MRSTSTSRADGIDYDEDNNQFTLTWTSKAGRNCGVFWSTDFIDWGADVNDFVPSAGDDTTSFGPFPHPNASGDIYFRVEELWLAYFMKVVARHRAGTKRNAADVGPSHAAAGRS